MEIFSLLLAKDGHVRATICLSHRFLWRGFATHRTWIWLKVGIPTMFLRDSICFVRFSTDRGFSVPKAQSTEKLASRLNAVFLILL